MGGVNGHVQLYPHERAPTEVEEVTELVPIEDWWGDMEEARDLLLQLAVRIESLEATVTTKFAGYDSNIDRFYAERMVPLEQMTSRNRDELHSLQIEMDKRCDKIERSLTELKTKIVMYVAIGGFIGSSVMAVILKYL